MVEVSQHFDDNADFGGLKTFAWMEGNMDSVQSGAEPHVNFDAAIRAAVEKYLVVEGLTKDLAQPDVLVKYHTGLRTTLYVTNFGMHYHEKVGWNETESVQDGQLTVDLVDPTSQVVIWRGTARGAMNVDPNQEIANRNADRAVKMIFEQYPPEVGKTLKGAY
jgi:hypothetical protein